MFGAKLPTIFVLIFTYVSLSCAFALDSRSSADGYKLKKQPIVKYELTSKSGLPVSYYISDVQVDAPLVIFIQGSGCGPAIVGADGEGGARVFDFLPTASSSDFNAMMVEKPYSTDGSNGTNNTENGCADKFNESFSFESWLEVLDTAYNHARKSKAKKWNEAFIIGVSEGAVMAAALQEKNSDINGLALIGASNGNQLFDFITLSYMQYDIDRIGELVEMVKEIRASPESSNKFAWGHPYKRWSSFLKVSTSDLLLSRKKPVYLVSGTADQSVPIPSTEYLYAQLVVHGVDVSIRRIQGAGHSLITPNGGYKSLFDEYKLIKDWIKLKVTDQS